MRCKPCDRNAPSGSGGQGRNRTTDTRIFSTTESPVRCQQAEDREGISPGPTEPPRPTEPIPNRNAESLTGFAGARFRSTACAHRDRTPSEPRAERSPRDRRVLAHTLDAAAATGWNNTAAGRREPEIPGPWRRGALLPGLSEFQVSIVARRPSPRPSPGDFEPNEKLGRRFKSGERYANYLRIRMVRPAA